MSETYRLVFRGEVLDGQHRAVVKKRLREVLDLDEDRAEVLFGGKTVVLKKAADTKTAARLQKLFKESGARLRVMPVDVDDAGAAAADTKPPSSTPRPPPEAQPAPASESTPQPVATSATATLSIAPAGAFVLEPEERAEVVEMTIDLSHLSLATDVLPSVAQIQPQTTIPDADFKLADVGSMLTDMQAEPVERFELVVDWDVAEVGVRLGKQLQTGPPPDIDVNFDVADLGADIGMPNDAPQPAVPNTDHLSVSP